MANYASLLATIAANITDNNTGAITGPVLKGVLDGMVGSLGTGYQFMGVAATSTNPGTPDQKVYYLAGPGTYTNFNNITVADGEIAVLKYDSAWSKVSTPMASAAEVSQLGQKVDELQQTLFGDSGVVQSANNTTWAAAFNFFQGVTYKVTHQGSAYQSSLFLLDAPDGSAGGGHRIQSIGTAEVGHPITFVANQDAPYIGGYGGGVFDILIEVVDPKIESIETELSEMSETISHLEDGVVIKAFDTKKVISTEKIPWQFLHSTSKVQQQHFCLGGEEYLIAQTTWPAEGRMGGYVWWIKKGRVFKYAPLTIDSASYKINALAWCPMTYDWTGGVIAAGQHMYGQTWKIGVLDGYSGALKTSYSVFKQAFSSNQVNVYSWFAYTFTAGKTYRITNNTNDNQVIRISTSYAQPYDTYNIYDTDGNMCKKTLENRGDVYEFIPATNAGYLLVYQANNQGSTGASVYVEEVVTDASAITAMAVYDMPNSADMRLFVASDYYHKIFSVLAKDGTDPINIDYPSGVSTICAMCFDSQGRLYVTTNDNSSSPSTDGNLIYVLDPHNNGAVIGSFTIPVKADGGMDIKDGILYTLSNRTGTINKISLGGREIENTGLHIPLSRLFTKKGVAISGGAGEPNVIYDATAGLFKMWFSRGSIAYTTSADGITWTTPTNVISNASRGHVFIDGNGTYHCYYILTDNSANKFKIMYHATSADGVTWGSPTQVMTAAQVASACSGSVWSDFQQFGSMYVRIVNGTWKMMFEGRTDSDYTWSVGHASSADGNTWTIDGNSPTTINHESFATGKGMRMIGRPKVFYVDNDGRYWLTLHFSEWLDMPTRIGIGWTTDLKTINILPSSPLLDFSEIEECDQLADAWMVEQGGKLYLYNSCVRNYSPQHSYIRVATLDMSAADLVANIRLD